MSDAAVGINGSDHALEQKRVVASMRGRIRRVGEPEDSCQVAYMVFIFSQAEKGIKLVQQGQYAEAVALFTEAIKCDPKDYR